MKSLFLTLSVKSSDEDDEGWRARDATLLEARSYRELMTTAKGRGRGIPEHHPSPLALSFPSFGGLFHGGAPLAASKWERGRALKGGNDDEN